MSDDGCRCHRPRRYRGRLLSPLSPAATRPGAAAAAAGGGRQERGRVGERGWRVERRLGGGTERKGGELRKRERGEANGSGDVGGGGDGGEDRPNGGAAAAPRRLVGRRMTASEASCCCRRHPARGRLPPPLPSSPPPWTVLPAPLCRVVDRPPPSQPPPTQLLERPTDGGWERGGGGRLVFKKAVCACRLRTIDVIVWTACLPLTGEPRLPRPLTSKPPHCPHAPLRSNPNPPPGRVTAAGTASAGACAARQWSQSTLTAPHWRRAQTDGLVDAAVALPSTPRPPLPPPNVLSAFPSTRMRRRLPRTVAPARV